MLMRHHLALMDRQRAGQGQDLTNQLEYFLTGPLQHKKIDRLEHAADACDLAFQHKQRGGFFKREHAVLLTGKVDDIIKWYTEIGEL
jgi:hypothetical protein